MMYSRSMIGLTLVLMIGLALPSSVMTQRKIAKGSKKNQPPSSQPEEIPVEVLVPQTVPMEEVKERVTKIVSDILNGKERRGLASLKSISSFAVQITGMTETECAENYADFVACYNTIITIASDVKNVAAVSKLKDMLYEAIRRYDVIVSKRRGNYPYVQLKNDTPYPVAQVNWSQGE